MSFALFTTYDISTILSTLGTRSTGLTPEQVHQRSEKYGKNQLAAEHSMAWKIFLRQFTSPFVYLLIGAAVLALVLGETLDAVMIFIFIAINTLLGFFQEYKSEQTLKLLKKYLVTKVKVIREGVETSLDIVELVPGDIVILEPGDIVPADVRLIDSFNLTVNEGVLTGESVPVEKTHQPLPHATKEIYQAHNICFSGTVIAGGRGRGIIFATGKDTNFGEVVALATKTKKVSTFEKEIGKFSKFILVLVAITLAIVVIVHSLLHKEPDPARLIIFAIALAVSVIPEALPVVTTFSLSIGAARLAKKSVVVKRLSAIEDLGSIEILCSDKTGTLTQNILEVVDIKSQASQKALLYANLASEYSANSRNQGNNAFEIALLNKISQGQKDELHHYHRVHEIPFDPSRKRASSVVEKDGKYELVVRGAPEDVLSLCTLPLSKRASYMAWNEEQGKLGVRVLAIASKKISKNAVESAQKHEKNLKLLGLIAFKDPVKTSTFQAVEDAKKLGVKVKILTGDSREVAGAVAYQIGLIPSADQVILGRDFEKVSEQEQKKLIKKFDVFARVTPQQKYKIIQLLRESYQVGFLGEGINDAPALKIANVALVVDGASDVAREASDIVLLDKSLQVIIDGIDEGRKVFANTTKYITATLSANFGNFFAVAIVSLAIPFLPMLPLQILLVNLLSDFPMISVATDSVDQSSITTPRRYNLKEFATLAILLGIVSTVFDFIFFGVFYPFGQQSLQTSWFIGSILTELFFLFSIRTRGLFFKADRPSRTLFFLTIVAVAITVIIPMTSLGQTVFGFTYPTMLTTIIGIVMIYFISTEAVKLLYYRFAK